MRKATVYGKRVVLRVDLDAPGAVSTALVTIRRCRRAGAKFIVLAGGRGAPGGKVDEQYTLKPLASELAKTLHVPVLFLRDYLAAGIEGAIAAAPAGSLIVLENTRFGDVDETRRALDLISDFSEAHSG